MFEDEVCVDVESPEHCQPPTGDGYFSLATERAGVDGASCDADSLASREDEGTGSPAAVTLFGEQLPAARRFAELLVTDGVVRGLIGPREAPRIWTRHLLNCAAITTLIPKESYVVDIGSGAGLPGIVLSVARPDLHVVLVEPLARRVAFLMETIDLLELPQVRVVRGRAEECSGQLDPADVVTARAVASLDRLAAWGLPLASLGGRLLAIKGASAQEELATHHDTVRRLGGGQPILRECGVGVLAAPTAVIEIVRERMVAATRSRRKGHGVTRR
jgi:16S rRNA (guanine527-N7)-methyltransferase